jgi:type IV secretory pathway VirB4 component
MHRHRSREFSVASDLRERSLSSELSLLDVEDDLVWQRDGRVTLLYRIRPLHEPALTDEDFDLAAMAAENVWSSLPENTSYQFIVLVERRQGLAQLSAVLPPIPGTSVTHRLLEEFRQARMRHLLDASGQEGTLTIQERRHFVAATFRPAALDETATADCRRWLRSAGRLIGLGRAGTKYEGAYGRVLKESLSFHRRVTSALEEQGVAPRWCRGDELVGLLHELLSPCASEHLTLGSISARSKTERDGFPRALLDEVPFLGDVAPAWSLTDDDVLVHQRYLEVGDRFATVVNLKELPDSTEPGMLVPLLQLSREKYRVFYRVDVPKVRIEYDALRAKANLAEGLRLENFIVQSNRPDPHADAVGKQSQEAMTRLIAAAQRIFGVCLQVVLYERSPEALEEAVQETLSRMSRAHGLHGHRETFMLKRAYLSVMPGAPPMVERRRKALTPVAVDLMPVFDTVSGEGRIPFVTPSNALVFYDPFDSRAQANANALITGIPGAGKSVLAQMLLSGYEIGCAGSGDPLPYVFILDNGASYERYIRLRDEDGRYVRFGFSDALVDIFDWSADDGELDEHVSRLEWLLLDILKVDQSQEERFERKKAAIEEALKALYSGGAPRDFRSFAAALAGTAEGADLAAGLFPFTEGKFARLFTANPALALREDVRAVCYDFMGLTEHPDFAAIALRLVIFQVRRFASRMSRRRRRTFLMLDESWSLLDSRVGRAAVTSQAAPFLTSSVRMGRKEGCAVIGLSQNLLDFSSSGLGSAIIENSAAKFVGISDAAGIESLRQLLQLNTRQVAQVRRLARTTSYHEFLFIQGERSQVIRVPLDPFSRWVFTTSPPDRDRIASLATTHPDLPLLEQMRLLASKEA